MNISALRNPADNSLYLDFGILKYETMNYTSSADK